MSLDEAAAVLLDGRLVERAEAAAERDQIAVGEPLIAQQHDGVIEPRLVNPREARSVHRTQIDAADVGAKRGAGRDDLDGLPRAKSRGSNGHGEYAKITDSEQTQTPPVVAGWDDGFFIQSANGDYRLNLGTVVQADGRFSVDDPTPVTDTFRIRKARVVLAGRAAKYFDYRFMPDFGSGSPVILDAYLDVRFSRALRIRVGKDKTPIGHEVLIGDASLLFPERSLASSLVPSRDLGFQAQGDLANGKVYYAGGVFNGIPDGTTSSTDLDTNNHKDLAGRLVVQPFRSMRAPGRVLDGLGFQIGGSRGTEGGVVPSFKTSIGQTWFAYAPSVTAAGTRNRATPSVFYYHKALGAFTEYVRSTQVVAHAAGARAIANQAWNVTASYVLTGEATSDRGVRPADAFDPQAGKWGALQLVARYAELTVDRRAFDGGFAAVDADRRARQYTLGVNWYPAAVVKYYVNVERTTFRGGYARRPEDVFFVRAQLAF